ncbi:MAG: ABC transporter ATP-binding protein [Acidobacteria bacterium]|nr:ABC transporter ATP-binding protein [Acidobacteriota bacterium]
MPPETLLSVRGLTKRFGGLTALDDVSFDVAPGEIYGVIGPNGAGKTTLFSCLVGALAPTAGEIRFRGRRTDGLPNHAVVRRGLVRTHQIVRPFRDMTVEDNVSIGAHFGAGRRRGGDARRRTAEVLERTGLSSRARDLAATLPIGDLKRLEIARALAAEPACLCLDEVMGGLNPSEIVAAMSLVRSIRDAGVTVLMIEHHVHAVAGVTDRILVLNFGEKIAEGPPHGVLADPAVISAYIGDEEAAS